MRQKFYSAMAAILSAILSVMTLTRHESLGDRYCVVFAFIFAVAAIVLAGYALEGSKLADKLSNLFTGEEGSDE